jgi:cytoskeletal protein CcmA (bactofilin family)
MALWKDVPQTDEIERPEQQPASVSLVPSRPEIATRQSAMRHTQESTFGPGVVIEGKIEGDGDMRIAGEFKGDIHIKGTLNIEKGAHVTAKITSRTITIEGELDGNAVAMAEVDLRESGQVIGDLKAKTLTVAAGSRMRGNVDFGWDESPQAKRTPARSPEKTKSGPAV